MRQRTTAINIRVTEGEKRKMETAAKKCGLSLSAYLRKLGLGKEVQATLPQEFYEAYRGLTSLRDNWKSLSEANVNANFNDVVSKLLKAYHSIGKPESLITYVTDRKGHDMRYAIDPTKIHDELGWLPETKFVDGIQKTIKWYLENQDWWKEIISGEYQNYYEKMYGDRETVSVG